MVMIGNAAGSKILLCLNGGMTACFPRRALHWGVLHQHQQERVSARDYACPAALLPAGAKGGWGRGRCVRVRQAFHPEPAVHLHRAGAVWHLHQVWYVSLVTIVFCKLLPCELLQLTTYTENHPNYPVCLHDVVVMVRCFVLQCLRRSFILIFCPSP